MNELLWLLRELNGKLDCLQGDESEERISPIREQWIEIVSLMLKKEQYDMAKQLFCSVLFDGNGKLNMVWLNTKVAVMYRMFLAYEREKHEGLDLSFQFISDPEIMIEVCQELKLVLWRIEFDLSEESQKEIVPTVIRYHVGVGLLIEMIDNHVTEKDRIYVANKTAMLFFKQKKMKFVLPLLMYAFDLDPEQQDTIFHITYVLYALREWEMAKEFSGLLTEDSIRKKALVCLIWEKQIMSFNKDCCENDSEENRMRCIYTELMPNLYKRKLPKIRTDFLGIEYITCIVCVNDERKYAECERYLKNLVIPEGFQLDIFPVRGATSITSAYQDAMKRTKMGIKIYLHQDLLIIDRYFLYDMLSAFQEYPEIGIIGIAGTPEIPDSCVWWHAKEKYYGLFQDNVSNFGAYGFRSGTSEFDHGSWQEVGMLDGVLLVTCVDIPWRTDLFDGWHFYDMSQCMEFRRKGYAAAVLRFEKPCAIHFEKCEPRLDSQYEKYRKCYQSEYKKDIHEYLNKCVKFESC